MVSRFGNRHCERRAYCSRAPSVGSGRETSTSKNSTVTVIFFLAWRLVKDDPRPPIIRVQGSERPLHLKWAPKTTNTPRHSRFRPNHFPTRRLSGVCRNHTGERPIVVQYPYWWGTDWTSYGSGVLDKVSALFNLLQTWYLQFSNVDVTSWHFY